MKKSLIAVAAWATALGAATLGFAPFAAASTLSTHPHADVSYTDDTDEICIDVRNPLTFKVYMVDNPSVNYTSQELGPGDRLCVHFVGIPDNTKMAFTVTGVGGSGAYAEVFDS